MKKIIEGKIWTAVCVALTLLMIASAVWIGMRYYISMDIYETPSMFLEGEYSVDGGEWKPIEKDRYITDHFNKIVFKGKMSKKLLMYFGSLTISSKNVWYTLKTSDGTVIQSYNFDDEKLSYEHTQTDKPLALDMPNTPGYCVKSIYPDYLTQTENITEDSELIFEVEYPYGYALVSYNDCVDVTAYYNEGMYLRFFYDALPPVLLFVLICFFGLFFFPVAPNLRNAQLFMGIVYDNATDKRLSEPLDRRPDCLYDDGQNHRVLLCSRGAVLFQSQYEQQRNAHCRQHRVGCLLKLRFHRIYSAPLPHQGSQRFINDDEFRHCGQHSDYDSIALRRNEDQSQRTVLPVVMGAVAADGRNRRRRSIHPPAGFTVPV